MESKGTVKVFGVLTPPLPVAPVVPTERVSLNTAIQGMVITFNNYSQAFLRGLRLLRILKNIQGLDNFANLRYFLWIFAHIFRKFCGDIKFLEKIEKKVFDFLVLIAGFFHLFSLNSSRSEPTVLSNLRNPAIVFKILGKMTKLPSKTSNFL